MLIIDLSFIFLLRSGCRHEAKLTDHFGTPLAAARIYLFSFKFALQIVHFGDVAGWGLNFIGPFLAGAVFSSMFFLILLSNRPFSVLLLLLLCLVLLLLLVLLMMLLMLLLSLLLLTGML